MKKKRLKRYLTIAGVVAALVLVSVWINQLEPAALAVEKETVYSGTVERGEMVIQVRGPGTLQPEDQLWISAQTQGRVVRKVELPGKQVEPSTVVLELTNPELMQQLQDSGLNLRKAEVDYAQLEADQQSQRLTQQAEAARIKAEWEEAKLQAQADEELFNEEVGPEIRMKTSRLREQQLANRYQIEQERLERLGESIEAQLNSQRVAIEQLEAIYELRKNQVDQLTVRAGIRGVLQEVPVEVGETVTPGANLALVADPKRLKAELQIPQVQANMVALGQGAVIDTRNGKVEGRVNRIDPAVREGTVTVDVEFDGDLPSGARPDLSVEGTITIERLEDVLYVGRPTYGQADSRIELFKVLNDGSGIAVRVPVRLGRSSVNLIEVVEGLAVGDEVILSDTSNFDGEDRIRLK